MCFDKGGGGGGGGGGGVGGMLLKHCTSEIQPQTEHFKRSFAKQFPRPLVYSVLIASSITAPPSYQECVLGKVDVTDDENKHVAGNMSYAPSYGYYDWLGNNTQYGVQTSNPSAPPLGY